MKTFNKLKSSVILLALIPTVSIMSPISAFAEGSNVSTVSKISDSNVKKVKNSSKKMDTSKIDGSEYIPDATIEDANQWVNKKGDDLVGFGSTLASPLSIIGFMIGLFMTLLGGFTRSRVLGKGLLVMAISIVVYVGVVFAPELVQYFSGWLSS